MQSYDSDDYDDATYCQLQSRTAAAPQQSPKMLFETAADRREKRDRQRRKVVLTTMFSPVFRSRHVDLFFLLYLHLPQKELKAEISELHPALALLLLVWRR